jgi:hypothetical protein
MQERDEYVQTTEQNAVNEGRVFQAWIGTTSLASGGKREVLLQTPNTGKLFKLIINKESSLAFSLEMYSGPTITGSGTAFTPLCLNRQAYAAGVAPATTLTKCGVGVPTYSASGTLIFSTTGAAYGGPAHLHHFVLNKNTKYLIRLISRAASNAVTLNPVWVEE